MDSQLSKAGVPAERFTSETILVEDWRFRRLTILFSELTLEPTFFDFLQLPQEIRLMIYERVFWGTCVEFHWNFSIKAWRNLLPDRQGRFVAGYSPGPFTKRFHQYHVTRGRYYPHQLLKTCKTIRSEAMSIFRDNMCLNMATYGPMPNYLPEKPRRITAPRMSPDCINRIREIRYHKQHFVNLDIAQFGGLRSIVATAWYECCTNTSNNRGVPHAGNEEAAAVAIKSLIRSHADLTNAGCAWYNLAGLEARPDIKVEMRAVLECYHQPSSKLAWSIHVDVRKWQVLSIKRLDRLRT